MSNKTEKIGFFDAIKLWRNYRSLFKKAKKIDEKKSIEEEKIKTLSNNLLEKQVREIIAEVPIEELAKSKRGIKVAAYKKSGYEKLGDIYGKSINSLMKIKGIGESSAKETIDTLEVIATNVRNNTSLKFEESSLNDDSKELINSIEKYRNLSNESKYSKELIESKDSINKDIYNIILDSSPLSWIFSDTNPKLTKRKYNELLDNYSNEFESNIDKEFDSLKNIEKNSKSLNAKELLSNSSSTTYAVLDKVNPVVLGNDEKYELEKETVEAIENQNINLDGLNCTLFRYQEFGVKYILHQGNAMLGDEMGLGKTIQAIAAMVSLKNNGHTHFMVVCPASVFINWQREIAKFSNLVVYPIYGKTLIDEFKKWLDNGGVALCTYESTDKILMPSGSNISLLIVDEAHFIKHGNTKRAKNVRVLENCSKKILFLSGTPLENNVEEMIELIKHLDESVAKEAGLMYKISSEKKFRKVIAPVYYRRRLTDVAKELPDKIVVDEWCTLNDEEKDLYKDSIRHKKYMEARRVSWNIYDVEKSTKATRLFEILEEAKQDGRKTIIFSFFLDTINFIKENISENCFGPINGSISVAERQKIIDDFTSASDGSVLLSQIQAGGTGLNIQAANVVVICEPQLKPSIENQAIARAHRMGQVNTVFVHRLLCDDTIEQRIYDVLKEKQEQFNIFADRSESAEKDSEIDNKTFYSLFDEEAKKISEDDLK